MRGSPGGSSSSTRSSSFVRVSPLPLPDRCLGRLPERVHRRGGGALVADGPRPPAHTVGSAAARPPPHAAASATRHEPPPVGHRRIIRAESNGAEPRSPSSRSTRHLMNRIALYRIGHHRSDRPGLPPQYRPAGAGRRRSLPARGVRRWCSNQYEWPPQTTERRPSGMPVASDRSPRLSEQPATPSSARDSNRCDLGPPETAWKAGSASPHPLVSRRAVP